MLTIEQLEANRKKAIIDAKKAEADAEARAKANTNLQKFLNNFESRVYAQLAKQLADAMLATTSGTTGTIEFQGTTITWYNEVLGLVGIYFQSGHTNYR